MTNHHCKNLIVHCIDFRLGKKIKSYMEERGLLGDCDIVSVAGGVKNTDFILEQIGISANLHHIQEVILLNHTDCGAYGGSGKFASFQEEREFHIAEMKKAGETISKKYPSVKVSLVLAEIREGNETEIAEITETAEIKK